MGTTIELFQRAVQYHQGGNLQQAEQLYRQILQVDPRHFEALHLLGVIAGQVGRPDFAVAIIRQALSLKPDFAIAHNNLGKFLQDQGRLNEAAASYAQALQCQPDYAEAHFNLGNVRRDQGKPDEAIASYRESLRFKPDLGEAHNNLGFALLEQDKPEEAATCFRQALRFGPNNVEAHNNLGITFWKQGRVEEAEACFRQALRLKPDHAGARNNLGNAFRAQGRFDEAIASFQEALRLEPDGAETHNNLALAFRETGRPEEALACVRQALRLKPEYADAHFNLGMIWLHLGHFQEGWVEFEWRQRVKKLAFRSFSEPRWDGSSLVGKTILLHAEQGLGDTLQFIRFAPLVKQRGGTVLFECPPELVRIMQSCAGIDHIIPTGHSLPVFDVEAPLLSLPAIMKTTLATVPISIPYLSANPVLTEQWRQDLRKYPGFKIGIIWQGNPRFALQECRFEDQRRSIPLACFEPLARIPGVRLFSLQKGYGTEQLAKWQAGLPIIDLGDKLGDFMDTAAVMMNLDLIISADTAPLHLAGALGRPVWAVLPFAGCWRWLREREDSPWYPTMRLFRQQNPGDWEEVFQRIAREIDKLILSLRK